MGKWVPHQDRRKCKNCGQWCELSKKDDFSGHKTWRDMCHTCHDVRTDQIALAKLAVGNKLKFLNNDNTMKRKEKKVTASINKAAEKLLETLQKDYGITQPGAAFSNDLNNYGGIATKLMFANQLKEVDKRKEAARIKQNKKQKEKRQLQKDVDSTAKVLSCFDIQEELKIIEKSQKMREERKQKDAVATGTLEEALEING
tara:strand:- start:77 stop:679 length:603 start_codon:yes stop_codon:yes gene_type:complete